MSRFTVLAVSGFLASALMAAPSFADEGTGHICHDASGQRSNDINSCCYNPDRDGRTNDKAYPFCPGILPQNNNYPTLDRSTTLHGDTCLAGTNCGPPAELSNVKPFYDTAAVAPPPPPPPPAPVAYIPPPPPVPATVVVPAAPVATSYAAFPFSTAGLGGSALAFGAVGAAALVGLVALAASDDDDTNSATSSTPIGGL